MVNPEPEAENPEDLPIDVRPIYVAKRLADAERLETVFTKAGIEYEVEPDTYPGGVIFRTTRVGAFFYVAPALRGRAVDVMLENGFIPIEPQAP
jgi:hypothetical protein